MKLLKRGNTMNKKKWIGITIGIILFIVALGVVLLEEEEPLRTEAEENVTVVKEHLVNVIVQEVVSEKVKDEVSFTGYTDEALVVVGYDRVQGRIGEVLVNVGDRVEKGMTLFTIDATNELTSMRIQVNDMLLRKSELNLVIDQLSEQLTRTEALYNEGVVAEYEYKQLKNQYDQYVLQRQQLAEQCDYMSSSLSALEKQGTVLSPYDGIVEKNTLVPGAFLSQADELSIRKEGDAICTIHVTEDSLKHLSIGKEVDVVVNSTQNAYVGVVKEIGQGGGEQILYPIKISINADKIILGGLAVTVAAETYASQALTVPQRSVINFDDESYIYTLQDNNTVNKVNVEVGVISHGKAEVKGELSVGDKVVVEGQFSVIEGMRVNWRSEE